MNSNRLIGRIFKHIRKLKMDNTWINETENDIEELKVRIKTSQNVFQLGTSYINLKVSRKEKRKDRSCLD